MCVVFGSYWCIIWGGWGGVGKKGDGLGSFLLKFGEMVKERTTNDDWVLCPEYCILSKNVIGNLNEDCERLFKSCECLKLRSQGIPCLSLMLFPTKD